jgi:hypothetical protein
MDRNFFKRGYRAIRHINLWLLLVIALVSGVVCVVAMRHNNLTALKLRDQVNQVDKDNGDVNAALKELREFIFDHMNTNLSSGPNAIKPPVQLKYRYERLLQQQQQAAAAQNAQIYSAAQAECEKEFPKGLSGSGRIPCVTNYITSHGVAQAPIDSSLYKFDFVSPLWTPDLAGWSLVLSSVAFALFVIRFGLERWIKAELRDL